MRFMILSAFFNLFLFIYDTFSKFVLFIFFCFSCFVNEFYNSQLFAAPASFEQSVVSKKTPRNVYLDLGAFMGDTLQMFKLNGVSSRCHYGVDWEVFAFEACPLLAHATQLQVDSLNGLSVDAPISYRDIVGMQELVDKVYKDNLPFVRQLRSYFELFEEILVSRTSSRGTYESQFFWNSDDREFQLKEAKTPLPISGTKYTLYAMGVGAVDTTLEMRWTYSNYINGGGNLVDIDYGRPSHVFKVPVVRFSRWLKDSFTEDDYIYVKMDIEGMEFLLLEDLIATGSLKLIREMDVEWHGRFNVPGRERENELRRIIVESGIILRDHY